jgi:hypothetical protein
MFLRQFRINHVRQILIYRRRDIIDTLFSAGINTFILRPKLLMVGGRILNNLIPV